MKTKYIKLLWILITSVTLGFVSCSSEDDPVVIVEEEEVPVLSFENSDVEVVVRNSMSFDIKEGNGDYKVFSLNDDIVKVELADNKVTINGVSKGKTSVVVSDKSNQYKQISVNSYYDALVVDRAEANLKKSFGGTGTLKVTILEGNDNYVAESDNKEMATVSVNGDAITITGKAEGKVNITIKDGRGLEIVVPVTIKETLEPYNEDQKETLMNNRTLRYNFNNHNAVARVTKINTTEDGFNLMGWSMYNQYLKVYFPGDKSVGEKEGAKISYELWSPMFIDKPAYFEIIKNDGTFIWAVYSVVDNGKLVFGNFMQRIEL